MTTPRPFRPTPFTLLLAALLVSATAPVWAQSDEAGPWTVRVFAVGLLAQDDETAVFDRGLHRISAGDALGVVLERRFGERWGLEAGGWLGDYDTEFAPAGGGFVDRDQLGTEAYFLGLNRAVPGPSSASCAT